MFFYFFFFFGKGISYSDHCTYDVSLGLYAFHFGITIVNIRDWGEGKERTYLQHAGVVTRVIYFSPMGPGAISIYLFLRYIRRDFVLFCEYDL